MDGLPIDPHWRCHRSGDCCTQPPVVTMSTEEAAILTAAAPLGVFLHFSPRSPGMVDLQAKPCPLYVAATQTCSVYSVRPYNCRRFACMRPDPATEPFDVTNATLLRRGQQSREVRRLGEQIERKARRWALTHGWEDRP